MIQKQRAYQKTAKGSEAIASRQHGLSPKLRSMLILVDGKRTCEELMKLSQLLGDTEQLLAQLLEQELIRETPASAAASGSASGATSSAPATTGATPAAVSTAPTVPLIEAQRFATRRLLSILGPAAEPLCLRIEAARNAQDFHLALTRAEGIVRDTRGTHIAAEFAAEMQLRKPA